MENCTHNDDERTLKGCWVSLELYKAMDLGYKVHFLRLMKQGKAHKLIFSGDADLRGLALDQIN